MELLYAKKPTGRLDALLRSLPQFLQLHSDMVTYYSELLATAAWEANAYRDDPSFTETLVENIQTAAFWHDIGKVCISNALWEQQRSLTPLEYSLVKLHPSMGATTLMDHAESIIPADEGVRQNEVFALCFDACLFHHERWDGKGYPSERKSLDIPLVARIVSIADAFDSMTAVRPYCKSKSYEEGLNEIWRCAGTQFDPVLAEVFVAAMSRQLGNPVKACG